LSFQTSPKQSPRLKQYTLKEVATHCHINSCWMVIMDKVYDLTDFNEFHPGGFEIMLEYAGADATNAFNEKPHTIEAVVMLEKYLIGELVKVINNFFNF
jgi:cytochrome b involved in lipid metabolism